MEKTVFNLKRHIKKAFYEGDKGYWSLGSRAWPNCLKEKMHNGSKSMQEAYNECISEYNEADRATWLLTYTQCKEDINKPREGSDTPYKESLKK